MTSNGGLAASLNRPLVKAALIFLIFAGSLVHRLYDLGKNPPPHATDDEYHYVWAGASLITAGVPTSWTMLRGYEDRTLGYGVVGTHSYFFVRPAFDHPPLFSILAGGAALLLGAETLPITMKPAGQVVMWDFNLWRVRLLPLALYSVSFFLLFALATRVVTFWPACVALLIYGFAKPCVIHHRLLVADNLTTPLLLANLLVLYCFLRGTCSLAWFAAASCLLVPLAALSKIVAISQAAVIAALLVANGRRRVLWVPCAAVALAVLAIAGYAAYFDWNLFMRVQSAQAGRFTGFHLLERLMATMFLGGHPEFSNFAMIGWVLVFAFALRRSVLHFALSPVAYLLAFTFFSASDNVFGWHHLPFYPFLAIAYAWAVGEAWRRPTSNISYVVLGLLGLWAFQGMFSLWPNYGHFARWVYLAFAVGLIWIAGKSSARTSVVARMLLLALLAIAVAQEGVVAYRLDLKDWIELRLGAVRNPANPHVPMHMNSR